MEIIFSFDIREFIFSIGDYGAPVFNISNSKNDENLIEVNYDSDTSEENEDSREKFQCPFLSCKAIFSSPIELMKHNNERHPRKGKEGKN